MENTSVDLKLIIENLEGDKDLIKSLVQTFLKLYPDQLADLSKYVEDKDAKNIALKAHSMKSAVKTFGAVKASEIALEMEKKGSRANLENIENLLADLKNELENVNAFFSDSAWETDL